MERRTRSSVFVIDQGSLLTVLLQDPTAGHIRHYLPGGLIEPDETPVAAAIRETREETSYDVVVDTASERTLQYEFPWDGRLVPCFTYFYRATLRDGRQADEAVDDAAYHRGIEWLPLARWSEAFAYHVAIHALMQAMLEA